MTHQLICWSQTANDTRDTASSVVCVHVDSPMSGAALARQVDARGYKAIQHLPHRPDIEGDDLTKIARGHGVTVKYPSGKRRTYREWD